MDERHLFTAARYVEMNPVRAKLVTAPSDWRWSSAAAHLCGKDDLLVKVAPLLNLVRNWNEYLLNPCNQNEFDEIRQLERTGRPLGSNSFIETLENHLNRKLMPQKRGPKLKVPILIKYGVPRTPQNPRTAEPEPQNRSPEPVATLTQPFSDALHDPVPPGQSSNIKKKQGRKRKKRVKFSTTKKYQKRKKKHFQGATQAGLSGRR
jgi:hypothetical protein